MTTLKPDDKTLIRVRIPTWAAEEIEQAARDAGIARKPLASAVQHILLDFARERIEERELRAG